VDPLSFTARIRLRRKSTDFALAAARQIVPEALAERFDEMARLRYWFGVSMLVRSHVRMSLLEALWPALKAHERPDVFASWFVGSIVPNRCYEFLVQALAEFKRNGQRIFDSRQAQQRFAELPSVVTIYRGGMEGELIDRRLGVCWTLHRDKAVGLDTQFRQHSHLPVLMTARAIRREIAGFLVESARDELLILPEDICLDRVEALAQTGEPPASPDIAVSVQAVQM
jgi:hypothetical protein